MSYNITLEDISNASTILHQDSKKISLRLPIYTKGLNEDELKYFMTRLRKKRIKPIQTYHDVVIVEKILKERKDDENVIQFTPKNKWYLSENYLEGNDQKLLRFEHGVFDIQEDIKILLENKIKNIKKPIEDNRMGVLLQFPNKINREK